MTRIPSAILKRRLGRLVSKWKAGFILCLAFGVFWGNVSTAAEVASAAVEKNVCVLVSSEIRPFLEAVESIKQTFSRDENIALSVFNLPHSEEGSQRDVLIERLKLSRPDLLIAVGPQAMQFLKVDLGDLLCHKLYTMVLNPEPVAGDGISYCGVSLNMPVEKQMVSINTTFPKIRTIGIPYTPGQNTVLVGHISTMARRLNISITPIPVRSRSELSAGLADNWKTLDALWLIPDHLVTSSESLIRYIIKEALSNSVPVFGYNRFFYESGATLSFVMDYKIIGAQTATLAVRVLKGEICQSTPPEFETWINPEAVRSIGLELGADKAMGLEGEKNGG